MVTKRDHGIHLDRTSPQERAKLISYINIKLRSLGLPVYSKEGTGFVQLAADMLESFRQKDRLLPRILPPSDQRIQDFIDRYLADLGLAHVPQLPGNTLVLDRYGMARELSLPPDGHKHVSPTLTSYRVRMVCCTTLRAIVGRPKGSSTLPRAASLFRTTRKQFRN